MNVMIPVPFDLNSLYGYAMTNQLAYATLPMSSQKLPFHAERSDAMELIQFREILRKDHGTRDSRTRNVIFIPVYLSKQNQCK